VQRHPEGDWKPAGGLHDPPTLPHREAAPGGRLVRASPARLVEDGANALAIQTIHGQFAADIATIRSGRIVLSSSSVLAVNGGTREWVSCRVRIPLPR
jgi:hypothetical protein